MSDLTTANAITTGHESIPGVSGWLAIEPRNPLEACSFDLEWVRLLVSNRQQRVNLLLRHAADSQVVVGVRVERHLAVAQHKPPNVGVVLRQSTRNSSRTIHYKKIHSTK